MSEFTIPYHGCAGVTSRCIDAIANLLQTSTIERAVLISQPGTGVRGHGFLLEVDPEGCLAVLPGFASGYGGEGPNGLSVVLAAMEAHRVPIEEQIVDADLFVRFRNAALTTDDVDRLLREEMSRGRPYDHIFDRHRDDARAIWNYVAPPMPFGIIEPRLFDLAKSFRDDPDRSLVSAYRRLEDQIRLRAKIDDEFGSKLMSRAFFGKGITLTWSDIPPAEVKGRANRFVSAFMAFRNPRAHHESTESFARVLREFLSVNELYFLEAESVSVDVEPAAVEVDGVSV